MLACGSGNGVCIVANKFPGVRAVNAHDVEEIEMARRHNDVNVLTLAGRKLSAEQATSIVRAFFGTSFEGGRHSRRVDQISEIEAGELPRRRVAASGGAGVSELTPDFFDEPLSAVDPEIADVLGKELERQQGTLEMIASENFVPRAVLEAAGSVLTNKYAEGYPGKRYYGGCEFVDISEQLAIDRAKQLFGAEHANVQPHAGAQANNAAYMALLEPGDTILGLELAHGGHLTHGMKLNVSGKLYDVAAYHVDRDSHLVDMDEVEQLAKQRRPKLIVAGWSAYSRQLDFKRFREIADEVGAKLMVDMAHFAGLVAAGEHPNPVPYADVVTSTTHKTLGGPRAGIILCKEELAADVNRAVFPGQQGGPLEHIIAAKAVCLKIAAVRCLPPAPEPDDHQRTGVRRGADQGRHRRAHRRHRRAPRAGRSRHGRPRRQAGRGSAGRSRHHGQPQRDPVRPAASDAGLRPAHRHAGADDAWFPRGGSGRDR